MICRSALFALMAALLWVGTTLAQPPSLPFGQGTHGLRRILTDLELEPVQGFDDIRDPKQTLIVVLGETAVLNDIPDGLEAFVRLGGAVLIATDRPTRRHPLEAAFGVTVLGVQVERPDDFRGRYTYRELSDCPLIQPSAGGDNLLFRRPPLPGMPPLLQRVATNRPACLLFTERTLTNAASLPPRCRYRPMVRGWFPFDDDGRTPQPFAARGEMGLGRILVLADHSLFINDMLLQTDNDNIDFTYNCLDWLTEGEPRRNRVLFIEEGSIKTNLDVPLKDLPVIRPPWNAVPPAVNAVLSSLETPTKNGTTPLEDMIDSVDRRGQTPFLLLSIVGTLLFGVYGLYRISSGRFRPESGVLLLPTALARQQADRDVLEQRRRALLANGNLWEAARGLARTCFDPPPDGREPVFRVEGGWWRRWTLGSRARRLWRLAYGRPVRVTQAEFRDLPRLIEEVRTARTAGTLRLEFSDASQKRPV